MKSFTRNSRKYGTTSQFVLYLDRYGTNSHTVSISNLNPDLMKNAQANYVCTFIQPERRKVQNLNTKKDKNWFKWWYLLFILPALGVLNGIIEEFPFRDHLRASLQIHLFILVGMIFQDPHQIASPL